MQPALRQIPQAQIAQRARGARGSGPNRGGRARGKCIGGGAPKTATAAGRREWWAKFLRKIL